MKKTFIFLTILAATGFQLFAQTVSKTNVLYDGFYIVKSGSVPAANIEIFTYLRFYDDGTVYLQAVSVNDPEAVSKWFGRDKTFSQNGTYKIDGANITIQVNNKASGEYKLEGNIETNYKGVIKNNQLCLFRDKETEEKCFVFTKIR